MLCRCCGLCCLRNRKINIVKGEGRENVSKTLQNFTAKCLALLSPIVACNRGSSREISLKRDQCDCQSGKTYCAAFCASPVAILEGSGHNASCICRRPAAAMVCNGWKQRRTVIRYARMSLD